MPHPHEQCPHGQADQDYQAGQQIIAEEMQLM